MFARAINTSCKYQFTKNVAKLPDFRCKKGIWKQKKVMIPLGMILSIVQIFGSILKQDLLNDRK